MTMKLVELATVVPPTVTVMVPVVAPVGTVAVICALESTVKFAGVPKNATVLLGP